MEKGTNLILIIFVLLFFAFIFYLLKMQISRVFTEKTSALRKKFPSPLKTFTGLTGSLSTKSIMDFRFKGLLSLEVHPEMIIVSSVGNAVCLRYGQYVFEKKNSMLASCLVIKDLPVQGENFVPFIGPLGFKDRTTLKIYLSSSAIDEILELAQSGK